jgi:hypothetical protein
LRLGPAAIGGFLQPGHRLDRQVLVGAAVEEPSIARAPSLRGGLALRERAQWRHVVSTACTAAVPCKGKPRRAPRRAAFECHHFLQPVPRRYCTIQTLV